MGAVFYYSKSKEGYLAYVACSCLAAAILLYAPFYLFNLCKSPALTCLALPCRCLSRWDTGRTCCHSFIHSFCLCMYVCMYVCLTLPYVCLYVYVCVWCADDNIYRSCTNIYGVGKVVLMKVSVSLITYLGVMEIFLVKFDGGYRLYGDERSEGASVATHRAVCKQPDLTYPMLP